VSRLCLAFGWRVRRSLTDKLEGNVNRLRQGRLVGWLVFNGTLAQIGYIVPHQPRKLVL